MSTPLVTGLFFYDTVLVVYDGVHADLPELDGVTETVDQDGRLTVSGHLANLRVSVSERGTVVAGSLAVYRYGTNAFALPLDGVREVVHEVGDRLGFVDPDSGLVARLDVGANVFTDHDPAQYARLVMGGDRVDARPMGPASVVVGRSPNQDALYDKTAELRAKGRAVPAEWAGRHVVRFETRCLRRVRQAFGRPVYAGDLPDAWLYRRAVRRAVDRFDRLRFALAPGPVPTDSVRALDAHLYTAGVEASGGAPALLRLVAALPKPTPADRTRASRVRSRIRTRATASGDDLRRGAPPGGPRGGRSLARSPRLTTDYTPHMAKFYAVRVGHKPGVYASWAEAQPQVHAYPGASHQSFDTYEEAQAFVGQPQSYVEVRDQGLVSRQPLTDRIRRALREAGFDLD